MISKGIKLFQGIMNGEGNVAGYAELTDLMEIPELGGESESVEITVLSDEAHMYENGIKNYGDNLAFKFLYKDSQFSMLKAYEVMPARMWKVELPDGASCEFGGAHSVKLDGVGVNAALTYTLSIKPNTAMNWSQATATTGE